MNKSEMFKLNYTEYGPWQWSIFRIIFGIYLTIHFGTLIPYAAEVFGPNGMIKSHDQIPTYKFFPNILNIFESDSTFNLVLILLTLFSLAFTVGFARRYMAVLLWYGHACLFNANIFIANPALPYMGWLLLACALIPEGEPMSLYPKSGSKTDWKMNKWVFYGAWFILAVGYTFSGLHKISSESWQNGRALIYVMELPTSRDWFLKDAVLNLPEIVLRMMTWSTLALEIFFLPMCFFRKTRIFAFVAMIFLHLGILSTVCIADLTFGMLMFHLFVIEPDWWQKKATNNIVYFDGVCGLCDRFITFMVGADTGNVLKFATQQGNSFKQDKIQELVKDTNKLNEIKQEETIYYYKNNILLTKSSAVLESLSDLGGIWILAKIFLIVPKVLRDSIYTLIAKNRYTLFGKSETCRLPKPNERAKFLD